jgi:hypothetical protein
MVDNFAICNSLTACNYVTRMNWVRHVAHTGDRTNFEVLWLKNLEGKKLLGRPGHGWEDNIKVDLREIGRIGVKDCLFTYRNNINEGCFGKQERRNNRVEG